jgi:predicted DNA-binding protein with PD1-like motif
MQAQRTDWGWMLRLDRGEEIVSTVASFAREQGLRCGAVSGIGSLDEAELGFFAPADAAYERRVVTGDFEIGALTGNLSELDGAPFAHLHVVLGDRGFAATTGHLFRGRVSVTCEVAIHADPGTLHRASRPDLGFNPLEPR